MKELKICSKCNIPKLLDEFHKRKTSKDGHDHHCKECGNARHREKYANDNDYKERVKRNNLKRSYKLSDAGLNKLHLNNFCTICGNEFKLKRTTYIDHCHSTGKVRGLLCPKCNILLGSCNDNVLILESAISYLKMNC